MSKSKIQNLAYMISSGNLPKSKELFGGASLIIQTNDFRDEYKNHLERYPQDILVFTDYAAELSWLVFELQNIFRDSDYANSKMLNYISVGESINYGLENNWNITAIMLTVIIDCLDSSI